MVGFNGFSSDFLTWSKPCHCDSVPISRISIPAWWDLVGFADHRKTKYSSNITTVRINWHLSCLDPELFCLNFPFFGFVKHTLVDSAPTCILLLKHSRIFLQHTFELREFFRRPVDLWGLIRLDRTGLLGTTVDLVWLVVGTMNLPYDWRNF